MPIDFPNSPTNGQEFTVGSTKWVFDGSKWNVVTTSAEPGPTGPTGPTGAASTVTGPTGPAGPTGPTGPAGITLTLNAQAGAYTLVLTDQDKLVEMGGGGTLTVPTNASVAFPVGAQINVLQTGASQVTIAGTGGVTVNGTPGLKLRAQWSSATLVKRGTNLWVAIGDLVA